MHKSWILAALVLGAVACSEDESPPTNATGGGGGSGADGGAGGEGGEGGEGGASACDELGSRLQSAIDQAWAMQPPVGGASVAVISGDCRWAGAAGNAHAGEPMTPAHLLRVGSVTKTYVATTLLSLAEEGALSLDDTLDMYVAGVPGGDVITIRMLLSHQSGIFNYTNDAAFMQQVINAPSTPVTPQEMVDVAIAHPPDFAPGTDWNYSNTGFILAGMVIEAVGTETAGEALRARALDVAALDETFFDGEETLPSPLATGFGATEVVDYTHALHPSVPWTAGSMVATAADVADWAKALYGGDVLPAARLEEMLTPVGAGLNGADYGLGVFLYDPAILNDVSPAVGHGGDIPGFHTDMFFIQTDGTVIAAIVNSETAVVNDFMVAAFLTLYPPAR
jgi:D-alanyl-D-alanine carboxypeptidase